jgi:hypothetical protein
MQRGTFNSRTFFAAGGLAVVMLLTACAAPIQPEPPADPAALRLSAMLAKTDTLSPTTVAADAAQAAARPEAKAKGMRAERLSMSFIGNAPDMLRPLAAARGLGFKVSGPQPHLPLFVVVDHKDASLEDVLKDVASQFGQRAALALTDSSIEIRYRTTPQ